MLSVLRVGISVWEDSVPPIDNLFIAANGVWALVAIWAANKRRKCHIPGDRPTATAKMALAAAFSMFYILLLGTDIAPAPLVSIARGFSFVAWPLVWILPDLRAVRLIDELRSQFMAELEKIRQEQNEDP